MPSVSSSNYASLWEENPFRKASEEWLVSSVIRAAVNVYFFVAPDESRKAIRLGKMDLRSAEGISRHVEALLASKIGGQPIARDTAAWLSEIAPVLNGKLAAVGLIEPQQRISVEEFITTWLASKKAAGFKPTSLRAWEQTADNQKSQF